MIQVDIRELNKVRIGALQECLDLIQNGWLFVGNINHHGTWVISFRKPRTGERLSIRISEKSYDVWRDGVLKKIVGYKPAGLKD